MMFNYHAESNALIILRAMQREIVAAREVSLPHELKQASLQLGGAGGTMVRVPPHPNIVEIYTAFADKVPGLPGAMNMYGDALPTRLNPEGSGRNMSLFLVMRRYDCSLREYLSKYQDQLNTRISTVLFTQLLEGVAFLHHTGVAHRDLKSDNLLVDISGGVSYPRLVITDFGCCLADSGHRLKLPYTTYDTDKGGNPALMAPEVAGARPGAFKSIDYSKSDLWSAGSIAYEIFGGKNPFYATKENKGLLSTEYSMADLPAMPPGTPPLLARLVNSMLNKLPSYRPEPKQAATICQLFLWSPSLWIKETTRVSSQDILQWLLTMTTKVLCESRWGNSESALQEYQLVATFLTTTSLRDIKSSLAWIQVQLDGMADEEED
jgi:PTEN induced putative kinase 1